MTRVVLGQLASVAVRLLHTLIGHLPHGVSLAVGAAIGAAYGRLGGPRVADARVNLAIAFPDRSAVQRRRILIESFANLGRGIGEVCRLGRPDQEEMLRHVRVEGLEHIERAQAASSNGGVLIVSAHIGTWELCATGLVRAGVPLSVVHHELEPPALDRIVDRWRVESGLETLKLGEAARGIFRALERGRCIGLLMDQNAKPNDGVFAPFFGLDACTRSGPLRVAMRRGVPVVTAFIHRVGASREHIVHVGPPIEIEAGGDDPEAALIRNAARMNDAIERAIRATPAQWIWSHRRWKTRPAGAGDSPYPARRSWLATLRRSRRKREDRARSGP